MNDIIERLRSGEDGLEYAAADEIERLRAECQRLAGEVSRAHKDALTWMERAAAANAERDAARAEATRLREALIAAEKVMRRVQDWGNARDTERADLAYQQVNTALAAKEPGHD